MKPELNGAAESHPVAVTTVVANDGNAGMRIRMFLSLRQAGQVIASLEVWVANPEAAQALAKSFGDFTQASFGRVQPVKLVQ